VCLPCGAFGAGVGGLVGLGVEGTRQLIARDFDGARLLGSTVGGAVTGGTIGLTGGASLLAVGGAAGLGGATGNLAKQGAGNLLGSQQGFNAGEFAQETAFSAIAGPIGAKINIPFPGVTSGRNSFSAITKSTLTKLNNGTIKNVSGSTIGKAVFAETVSDLPGQAIKSGLDIFTDFTLSNNGGNNTFNDFGSPVLDFPSFAGVGSVPGASGGFVLYPSKPNTNMMRNVYSK